MNKKLVSKVGGWAFIVGVVIALFAGLAANILGEVVTTSLLIVLGLIVGLLNVTANETKEYLLASVSLVIVTSLGGQVLGAVATIGPYLQNVLMAIMTFVIPAVIIVALRAVYSISHD